MRISRIISRGLLVLMVLILSMIFLQGCAKQPDQALRYGGQYYPGEFLLKGYPEIWSHQDLMVEHILFSSGTENNQALISGEIDVNVGSDSKTVALFNAMPDDVLIIATIQRGDRYSTIVRPDSPYTNWHDLKGKTVGTRLGTGAEQVLLRYFNQSDDLSWDDFNWVNLKIEDMASALSSGQIEAFTAWEPTPAIAEAQGIGRVLRSYGDLALVPVSIHTTVEYANEHRSELVSFLAAHIEKVQIIQSDPDRAANLAAQAASAKGIEVSADAFRTIFNRVDFSLEFDDDVLAAIQGTAEFLKENGKIESVPNFQWDNSFLEEAVILQAREE